MAQAYRLSDSTFSNIYIKFIEYIIKVWHINVNASDLGITLKWMINRFQCKFCIPLYASSFFIAAISLFSPTEIIEWKENVIFALVKLKMSSASSTFTEPKILLNKLQEKIQKKFAKIVEWNIIKVSTYLL